MVYYSNRYKGDPLFTGIYCLEELVVWMRGADGGVFSTKLF
jgi:hypothetical protein